MEITRVTTVIQTCPHCNEVVSSDEMKMQGGKYLFKRLHPEDSKKRPTYSAALLTEGVSKCPNCNKIFAYRYTTEVVCDTGKIDWE